MELQIQGHFQQQQMYCVSWRWYQCKLDFLSPTMWLSKITEWNKISKSCFTHAYITVHYLVLETISFTVDRGFRFLGLRFEGMDTQIHSQILLLLNDVCCIFSLPVLTYMTKKALTILVICVLNFHCYWKNPRSPPLGGGRSCYSNYGKNNNIQTWKLGPIISPGISFTTYLLSHFFLSPL